MLRDREKGRGRGKEKGRERGRGKEGGREGGKREGVRDGEEEGVGDERERGLITMLGHYTQKSSILFYCEQRRQYCRLVVSYNQFNGSLASHLCVYTKSRINGVHSGILISFQL